MSKDKILTEEALQTAYTIIAGIVAKHGDTYLPIFKRLHEEKELRKANADLKAIALQVLSGTID